MVARNPRTLALALVMAISCGGSDPISPPPPPPPPPPPSLVALRLTVPDSIVTGQPFTLSVASLNASGQPDGTWSGQVSLSSSAGTLEPSSIAVTAGTGTAQATLRGHTGGVSFSVSSGTIQANRAAFALSGAPAARLEIEPSAFLLPSAGSTVALIARAFDASGAPTTAPVTWVTSNPGTVTVSAAGVATAVVGSGSTQVTALSGSIRSQPALGLVTRPPQGAVLVPDAQVVGSVTPVDPAAAYGLGWKYRVRLKGITPSVGQIILATGSAPLGGRVVAVTPAGAESDVTLELLPLGDLLPELELHQSIPLTDASTETSPPAFRSPWAIARPPEVEFEAGAFQCKASTTAGQVILVPITGSSASLEVESELDFDVDWSDGLQRAMVHGSIVANLRVSPRLTAAVEGGLECKFTARTFILPIGGILSAFIAGQVPVGLGFAFEGKVNFGDLGFDLDLSAGGTVALGLQGCASECHFVSNFTSSSGGSFEPRFPALGADFQVELAANGFVFAELGFGPPFLEDVKFDAIEARLGLKQEAKLSSARVQANNPAYASEFRLAPFFKAGTAAKLEEFAAFVGITVGELKFEPALDAIAQSPRGTLQVTPSRVNASRPGQPGDSATFTVTLNPVTYLTSYAVDDVQIFRKTSGGGGPFFLEPAGGACSRITPAATGQATFTCKTDFPVSMIGEQTFYAFVKPRMGGVLPLLLEVAPDSKAVLVVDTTTIQVTKTSGFVEALIQNGPATVCDQKVTSNAHSYTAPAQNCGAAESGTFATAQLAYTRTDAPVLQWTVNGSVVAAHADKAPTPYGYSTLQIEFKVLSGTVGYQLTGVIEATDAGPISAEAYVNVMGPSGELFEDTAVGPAVLNVNRTGVLGPGAYRISIGAIELFNHENLKLATGQARVNLTFRLTPTPTPVP